MKINLVSDATYYPVRVGNNSKTAQNGKNPAAVQNSGSDKFSNILLEKLSPNEATAIQKLFGDFKPGSVGRTGSESKGNITRGKFVDITI